MLKRKIRKKATSAKLYIKNPISPILLVQDPEQSYFSPHNCKEDLSPFTYRLPHFQGPITLLLELLRRQELDFDHIELSPLCIQLLEYLQRQKNNPKADYLSWSAQQIYFLSQLFQTKASHLLPFLEHEETKEEVSLKELILQLRAFSKIQPLARFLYHKQEQLSPKRRRILHEHRPHFRILTLDQLSKQIRKCIEQAPKKDWQLSALPMPDLREHVQWWKQQIEKGPVNIIEIFYQCQEKFVLITKFLSLLEIGKTEAVIFFCDTEKKSWVCLEKDFIHY